LIAEGVIDRTRDALTSLARDGVGERGNEGLVFWAGVEGAPCTTFITVVVPGSERSPQSVFVSESSFGKAAMLAREAGVALLAQVHSHPGTDARHSDGDDDLILMPFEGMLSIVVPRYGLGWTGIAKARVHQYQDGMWKLCSDASVLSGITTAPLLVDAR